MPCDPPTLDALSLFLEGIGRHRLLQAHEEISLARRIEQGDKRARQTMIESNLRLVVLIARAHCGRGLPLLDLIQEGTIGLMRAVDGFDWRCGNRFSAYAGWWIRQTIERALGNHGRAIRVPIHVLARRQAVVRARARLEALLSRAPTPAELAVATGFPREQVEQVLAADASVVSVSSLAEEPEDPEDAFAAADDGLDARRERRRGGQLPAEERRVIELRFGLGAEPYSRAHTGRVLSLTPQRVKRMETRALARLRGSEIAREREAA